MKLKRVSPKLGKRLRDVGFDIMCDALYRVFCMVEGGDDEAELSPNVNPIEKELAHNDWVSAPTLELAKMWFREVHKITIVIDHVDNTLEYYFDGEILIADEREYNEDCFDKAKRELLIGKEYQFKTYEEALEIALLKSCDKIKK